MTWLLKHGDTTREFATKEAAMDAKSELDGLGGDLSIEEKETGMTAAESAGSDNLEVSYIEMPYDDEEPEPETETDGGHDRHGGCPACGAISDKIYRCSECGRDLAGIRTGVGMGGERP